MIKLSVTEGVGLVEHVEEEDSESPHIHFETIAILLLFLHSCSVDLGRHELLCPENSAVHIFSLLTEAEICDFEDLR